MTNSREDKSPCFGCFYESIGKKAGHCEQCSSPAKYADKIHVEGAITAIDYASPLVVIGKDIYSGGLLYPLTLGGGR
jgi:hypothetical protein